MDVYLKYILPKKNPDLSLIWMMNPDTTMHMYGMGTPAAIDAIKAIDRLFVSLLDKLRELGIDKNINILIISDLRLGAKTTNPHAW